MPGHRIGFTPFNLGPPKIMQEVITLRVFLPSAVFYLGAPLKSDYLWAAMCLVGPAHFICRAR